MGGSRNAVSKRFIYHNFYCSNGTIQTGQSHYESDSERCLSSAKVYLDWPVVGCGLVLSEEEGETLDCASVALPFSKA